jgi:zinc protease
MQNHRQRLNKSFDYIKSAGGIEEYRLKTNGLSILFMEDHKVPLVNVMVTYKVGSRNEATGHTGATHLLEHLMFKGSKNFNKKNNRHIWSLLEARGAKVNATTWYDRTNYYELLPKEHLEDALAIEADRMRNAYIRERDRASEMTVVRNEYEWGENNPLEVLDKSIWATAFQAHPYHHPTIGWQSDIENVPITQLKKFYNTFYWPNNAVLSLIGDFDKSCVLRLIEKYFGKLPASPCGIPSVYTKEAPQEGERRVVVTRAGQSRIVGIAHKIPEALNPDFHALFMLSIVLCGGKSSRLYGKLVDMGLAISVESLCFPLHDPGLFIVYAELTSRTSHQKIEKIIKDEYRQIQGCGINGNEFERAKSQIISSEAMSRDGYYTRASSLNEAIALGDWTFYVNFLDKIRSVRIEDIKRVAKRYLVEEQSTVGWFVPKKLN